MPHTCLAPGRIGTLQISNKLIFPAMTMGYCDAQGRVTQRFADFHLSRAKGGVGLVILGNAVVRPDGRSFAGQAFLTSDEHIPGLRELVSGLHTKGVRVAVQLCHAGRLARQALSGRAAWGPSQCLLDGEPVAEASAEMLGAVVEDFAAAARRAVEAGADAVELNAGQGRLLQQFHSRSTNHRQDAYGGSPHNRARLTRDILRAIRREIGPDRPLLLQLGIEEPVPDGLTLEESQLLGSLLVDDVDVVHVTSGHPQTPHWLAPSWSLPETETARQAAAIRKALQRPVIAGGRITSLAMADSLLERQEADFAAIGRALLADPLMVRKSAAGFPHRVRPCIVCDSCLDQLTAGETVTCSVNPFVGREAEEDRFYPSGRSLHVVVVGGGPCGLSAACTLRHKGHRVTLLEKTDQLGGHLRADVKGVVGRPLATYVDYISTRIIEMGVDVHRLQEADAALVSRLRPHVVVAAVGALPLMPDIPGLETSPFLLAGHARREGLLPPTGRAVVLGGGREGCETAQWLASEGCKVTLIEKSALLAQDAGKRYRVQLVAQLKKLAVACLLETQVARVAPQELTLHIKGHTCMLDNSGTLLIAMGYRANPGLRRSLVSRGFSVLEAGDCVVPGSLSTAIAQGVGVGLML